MEATPTAARQLALSVTMTNYESRYGKEGFLKPLFTTIRCSLPHSNQYKFCYYDRQTSSPECNLCQQIHLVTNRDLKVTWPVTHLPTVFATAVFIHRRFIRSLYSYTYGTHLYHFFFAAAKFLLPISNMMPISCIYLKSSWISQSLTSKLRYFRISQPHFNHHLYPAQKHSLIKKNKKIKNFHRNTILRQSYTGTFVSFSRNFLQAVWTPNALLH